MSAMLKLIGVLLLAAVGYLLLWPVPIDPAAWTPPKAPAWTGPYASNSFLASAERIAEGEGNGPEAVVIGDDGRVYTGYLDGRVVAIEPETGAVEELENTGGRPLGVSFGPEGQLYIADAVHGLMERSASGRMRVVSDTAGGQAFGFVDDLTVDSAGRVYFSDASWKFGVDRVIEDFYEHRGNGRILRYDPSTARTEVLIEGLHFANGVALGPDDRYLLINETARYQVWRYWLRGERAGELEVFIDNLPGFPDNITFDGEDTFWLALYGPRSEDLDALLPIPWLRKVVLRLPEAVQPLPPKHGVVLGLNLDGEVVHNLQDRGPTAFAPITSVRAHGDWLYLGSLSAPSIARVERPDRDGD